MLQELNQMGHINIQMFCGFNVSPVCLFNEAISPKTSYSIKHVLRLMQSSADRKI